MRKILWFSRSFEDFRVTYCQYLLLSLILPIRAYVRGFLVTFLFFCEFLSDPAKYFPKTATNWQKFTFSPILVLSEYPRTGATSVTGALVLSQVFLNGVCRLTYKTTLHCVSFSPNVLAKIRRRPTRLLKFLIRYPWRAPLCAIKLTIRRQSRHSFPLSDTAGAIYELMDSNRIARKKETKNRANVV